MKGHKLRVVCRDGRLRSVELDGLDLTVAVEGLEIRFPEDGLPEVSIRPIVEDVEVDADAVSLARLEAVVVTDSGVPALRIRRAAEEDAP